MKKETVDLVAILWDGPYTIDQIRNGDYLGRHDSTHDRGLYQIYSDHDRPDTLLYIGCTESSFATRIPAHDHWTDWVSYPCQIFLGRIVNLDSNDDYRNILLRTELFLIYFTSPPVNKHGKNAYQSVSNHPATVVINFKKRFRLPLVVSNLVEKENIWQLAGGSLGKEVSEATEEDLATVLTAGDNLGG